MRIVPVSYYGFQKPKSNPIATKGLGLNLRKGLGLPLNSDETIVENLVKKYPDKAKSIRTALAWEIPEFSLRGVYDLKEAATKSSKDKEEVIDILQNLVKVADKRALRKNLLYGKEGDEDFYPGIVKVLEELTGERVDVDKLLGRI